jgi:heterodisulfide reductase subunit A
MAKQSLKWNITNEATVLIIGGGIAGLTAANAHRDLGISPFILEKEPFLGGHGIQFACKATESCQQCSACSVEEALKRVTEDPGIIVALCSDLQSLTKENGRFAAVIEKNYV